jgi:hypothetical protein
MRKNGILADSTHEPKKRNSIEHIVKMENKTEEKKQETKNVEEQRKVIYNENNGGYSM